MPSIITHYLCGAKTLALFEDQQLKNIIFQNRQVFNLGTQGPDILFYHRVWPWTKKKGINEIGETMHQHFVNVFFSQALKYIINQEPVERNMLTAYLCGYISHYALDFHTHPYIFYKTGFLRPGEPYTAKYTYYHRMFETALDVLMLKAMQEKRPIDMGVPCLLKVSRNDALSIGGLYQSALNAWGKKITALQVAQSIKDMVSVQTILQDRLGMKKKFLSQIEKLLGNYPLMASMIYPAKITDGLDYLNLNHNSWHLPWDPSASFTFSFPEMFSQAAAKAKEMAETMFFSLSGDMDPEFTLKCLGNRSFSTGRDCRHPLNFEEFNCIFEKETPGSPD